MSYPRKGIPWMSTAITLGDKQAEIGLKSMTFLHNSELDTHTNLTLYIKIYWSVLDKYLYYILMDL